jgi:hypothetical protein
MKTLATIGLTFLVGISAITSASAQRLLERAVDRAKDRVERRVERKVDEAVDKQIDKGLDAIEESVKNDEKSESEGTSDSREDRVQAREDRVRQRGQGILKGLGLSGEPVTYENSYQFSTSIKMHMENFDGNGKKISESEFITFMDPGSYNFAYEIISGDPGAEGKGLIILDFKNEASLILSEEGGNKTGIAYGLGFILGDGTNWSELDDLDSEQIEGAGWNPYVKKTGRTKRILGYSCDEYHYNDPEQDSEGWFWITKDLNVKTHDFFGSIFRAATWSSGMSWGYLMESEAVNKETKEKSRMQVTDIKTNAGKRFAISDYQITNIGRINIPVGE